MMQSRLEIVCGQAVGGFLERIQRNPYQYREVIVCTPFLDVAMRPRIRDIAISAPPARCAFSVITRKEAAQALFNELPGGKKLWRRVVRQRHRLHAKVYLAIARTHPNSEAIVTSANLTNDGVHVNDELGLRITGRTEEGRYLIAGLRQAIQTWIN